MAEDSRNDLMARVRKLNDITDALKNTLPPHVSEVLARYAEVSRAFSLGDTRPTEAPRPAASTDLATPSTTDTRDTKRRKGLPTPDIAVLFDGAPYAKHDWGKRPSQRKWLKSALLAMGAKGGAPAMWCPLKLGQLVWGTYPDKQGKLKRTFQQNPALDPWRDEWDQFVDQFSDDD